MAPRFAQAGALASLLIALCLGVPVVTSANAQEPVDANSPRIELPGHVLDALGQATPLPIQKNALDDALTLTIVLRRADEQGFQAYLKDIYDSRSANYRKFLTQEELATRFGPTVDDYQVVRRYFEANGFVVTAESRNRLTMAVRGTRRAAGAALSVRIKDWQIGTRVFYANDRNPSVPPEIASRVEAISGLSNAGVPTSPLGQATPIETAVCEYAGGAESAVAAFIISTATFAGTPLMTAIMSAFAVAATVVGLPAVTIGGLGVAALNVYCLGLAQGLNYPYAIVFSSAAQGARKSLAMPNKQKIGLLEFDGFHASDVQSWIGLAGGDTSILTRLSSIAVNGGVASPGRGESEVLLDIATLMLMNSSPNASYVVYSAPASTSFQQIFNAMIDDQVTVISNSWSDCEDEHTVADVLSIDSVLMEASASGISVFNGTGDTGATCLDGSSNTAGVPATSPHATAVGGTTPSTGPGYTYGGEAWWNGTSKSPPTGQGGFGVSRYFERPDYQSGLTDSPMRSIPDLAVPADPRTGIGICQASAGGCPTGLMYGGTSMAAPEMAGIAALLNEILGANIGEANPALYPLQGTKAFHSPASMGTDFAHVGLGSPHLNYIRLVLSHGTIGPVSSASSIVASSRSAPADGTTRAVVQVNLIDNNGYPVSGKTVHLTPSVASHAIISAVSAASDVNDGAFVFNVTDATIETVTFTATDGTDAITLEHTATIDFLSPPATTGGIAASPNSVPADGSSTSTITVTLQNALGQGARDKSVTLSQSAGHSIVTAPTPAVTDVSGQIQFTVTDNVAETVTYSAIDVSDGNLPVPGSTQVTFTGAGTSCVTAPPVAAAGFVLTPFANGFPAQNFFYSGVSWGGCPGASNPTFDASGRVFVSDFYDGKLYRFGMSGGAVSSANTLATVGQTLYGPIFAKDGSFYILQAATGSGVSSGKIMKIDPATGAVLATLATGLTCPSPIALDPLSGDIFFTDTCFSGATNASLYRLLGTMGATPTVVVYATLPATGNGPVAFAPDGTIYVATDYNATGSIVQVAGTDKPQPPTMTKLSGISSDFWVNVAQVQASGAAKSLLVHNSNALKLVDITTNPFTTTVLATGSNITTGTIGPDGCLYSGSSDSIFKLTPSSGACGFAAGSPLPGFMLSPSLVTPDPALGTAQTFAAAFSNISVAQGTPVTFYIVGANPQRKLGSTDASGMATMTYSGTFTGMDTIVATANVGPSAFTSNQARVTWAAGKHKTFVDLNLARTSSPPGQLVVLTASLYDVSSASPAAIPGETLQLAIGAQSCSAVTDSVGDASCSITPTSAGSVTLTGSYAGNASYLPSSSSQPYTVASTAAGPSVPGAPVITGVTAGNSQIIVSFNPPASDGGGAIVAYVAVCTAVGPSGALETATGTGSPIVVNGVANGVSYTCAVSAMNGVGTGPASAPSSVATPLAPEALAEAIPTLEPLGLLALLLLLVVTVAYRWRMRRP